MGLLTQLEIDFEYDLVDEFLSHFGIMCDLLEPLIIGLSKQQKFTQNINELFRIFHNIKSSAGFMGLKPIINLASVSEDVLEQVRNLDNVTASDEFIDWLLLVSDQFVAYKNDISYDKIFFSILNPRIIKIPQKLIYTFK